jgi:hypothetical protein
VRCGHGFVGGGDCDWGWFGNHFAMSSGIFGVFVDCLYDILSPEFREGASVYVRFQVDADTSVRAGIRSLIFISKLRTLRGGITPHSGIFS